MHDNVLFKDICPVRAQMFDSLFEHTPTSENIVNLHGDLISTVAT